MQNQLLYGGIKQLLDFRLLALPNYEQLDSNFCYLLLKILKLTSLQIVIGLKNLNRFKCMKLDYLFILQNTKAFHALQIFDKLDSHDS